VLTVLAFAFALLPSTLCRHLGRSASSALLRPSSTIDLSRYEIGAMSLSEPWNSCVTSA